MTNIEALVTDLETSKQLQEAGIKYETAFVWMCWKDKKWRVLLSDNPFLKLEGVKEIIPTFTAGELMQVLPNKIIDNQTGYEYFLYVWKIASDDYSVGYSLNIRTTAFPTYFHNSIKNGFTFKEALAKLCLWCKWEGYL